MDIEELKVLNKKLSDMEEMTKREKLIPKFKHVSISVEEANFLNKLLTFYIKAAENDSLQKTKV